MCKFRIRVPVQYFFYFEGVYAQVIIDNISIYFNDLFAIWHWSISYIYSCYKYRNYVSETRSLY